NAIERANMAIWSEASEDPDLTGMGSTLVVAVINAKTITIGSVGDSRLYRFRDSQLEQVTTDDSYVAGLIASGTISDEEALIHPMRHVLSEAAGARETIN